MRTMIAFTIVAVASALGSGTAALAIPLAGGQGTAAHAKQIEQIQYWRGDHCERLRRACTYKEERGEVGEGNCRRYRAECSRRLSYCGQLRQACLYKERRGEIGEGNCRRYRRECGGSLY